MAEFGIVFANGIRLVSQKLLEILAVHWSEVVGDPLISDAIRDRLEDAALITTLIGESYGGVKACKLAAKRKDA